MALAFQPKDFWDVFSDPDAGDSLKAVQVASLPDAEHGALALNGTAVTVNQEIPYGDLGTLSFTPVANWNGDATFTFTVVDQSGAASAAAQATITVTAVADAPRGGDAAGPREPHGPFEPGGSRGVGADGEHGGGHGALVHGGAVRCGVQRPGRR